MVPGIVHFSAHYFWFLTQITFHCYQKEEIPKRINSNSLRKKYALLLFIDQSVGLIRAGILIWFLFLMYFQPWDDPFNITVVPLGTLSLYIIQHGHWFHLCGVVIFLYQHSTSYYTQTDNTNNTTNERHEEEIELNVIWYVSIIIGFACVGSLFS